jgi:hypothetical protein
MNPGAGSGLMGQGDDPSQLDSQLNNIEKLKETIE